MDHIRAQYDGQQLRKSTNSKDGHIESATKDAGVNDTAGEETRIPQAPEHGTEISVGGTHTEGGEEHVDPHNIQSDTPCRECRACQGTVANAEPTLSTQQPNLRKQHTLAHPGARGVNARHRSILAGNSIQERRSVMRYEQWTALLYSAAGWA